MLELLLFKTGPANYFPNSGPGSKYLLYGDANAGFFGEVTATELFTTAQVTSYARLRAGVDLITSPVWLKFAYKGRFLFIAKQPIRSTISWNDIYKAGAAYGEDNDGGALSPQNVNQIALAKKGTDNFVIRLIKGDAVNPSEMVNAVADTNYARDSEWNQLLYRLIAPTRAQFAQPWANYSNTDMGITSSASVMLEHNTTLASGVLARGNTSIDAVTVLAFTATTGVWRPVVEKINLDAMLLKPIEESASALDVLAADGITYEFGAGGADLITKPENVILATDGMTALEILDTSGITDSVSVITPTAEPVMMLQTSGDTATVSF